MSELDWPLDMAGVDLWFPGWEADVHHNGEMSVHELVPKLFESIIGETWPEYLGGWLDAICYLSAHETDLFPLDYLSEQVRERLERAHLLVWTPGGMAAPQQWDGTFDEAIALERVH